MVLNSKKFKLHDEIIKLKEKYKTKIGYGGIKLSKGQNQRLVLTRSFISCRNIMIFDDSFSAIDNKNKRDILNNLLSDDNKFTLIIATNDISIAPKFDKIVFIDDYKIICETHKNLLKNKNYKKVWEISQNLIGENYE